MDALQEQLLALPGFSRRYSDWRAGHRAILAAEAVLGKPEARP